MGVHRHGDPPWMLLAKGSRVRSVVMAVAGAAVCGMLVLLDAPVASAEDPGVMWVDGDTTLPGEFSGSIIVIESDVTLDCAGHSILGPGYDLGGGDIQAGVVVEGWTTGVTVENCVISGFSDSGGIIVGGTNTTVRNNVVDDSQGGISVFTNDNTIVGNTVTNATFDGFLLRGDEFGHPISGNLVQGNHAEDNVSNFSLEFADYNALIDNVAVGHAVTGLGFQIAFSSGNALVGNSATGAEVGFALSGANGTTMKSNVASACSFGIQLWDASDSELVGNTAHHNLVEGFSLVSSAGIEVRDNQSSHNAVGFAVVGSLDAGNVLAGNTAEENAAFGFWVYQSSGNTLKGNHAVANGDGFQLWEASANALKGNLATGNDAGYVLYDASYNTLKGNIGDGNGAFYFAELEGAVIGNVLKGNLGCFENAEEWESSNEFKDNEFSCPS